MERWLDSVLVIFILSVVNPENIENQYADRKENEACAHKEKYG